MGVRSRRQSRAPSELAELIQRLADIQPMRRTQQPPAGSFSTQRLLRGVGIVRLTPARTNQLLRETYQEIERRVGLELAR